MFVTYIIIVYILSRHAAGLYRPARFIVRRLPLAWASYDVIIKVRVEIVYHTITVVVSVSSNNRIYGFDLCYAPRGKYIVPINAVLVNSAPAQRFFMVFKLGCCLAYPLLLRVG